jgi:hypothetical protein
MGAASAKTKKKTGKMSSTVSKNASIGPAKPNKTIDSMYKPVKKEDWRASLAKESVRHGVDSDVELASSQSSSLQSSLPSSLLPSTPSPNPASSSQTVTGARLVQKILQTEPALTKALDKGSATIYDLTTWDPQKLVACLNHALMKYNQAQDGAYNPQGLVRAVAMSHAKYTQALTERAWDIARRGRIYELNDLQESERSVTDAGEQYKDWEDLRLDKECLNLIYEPIVDFKLSRICAMLTYCYRLACTVNAQGQVFSADFVMAQHSMRYLHDQGFQLERIIEQVARDIHGESGVIGPVEGG